MAEHTVPFSVGGAASSWIHGTSQKLSTVTQRDRELLFCHHLQMERFNEERRGLVQLEPKPGSRRHLTVKPFLHRMLWGQVGTWVKKACIGKVVFGVKPEHCWVRFEA